MTDDNNQQIKESASAEELAQENEQLKQQVQELENNWKRALADYRNFQKRVDEEKQSFVDFANATLIRKIVGVLDNLELLNRHIDDKGLKMIVKELNQILKDEGVTEVKTEEAEFNSSEMDAVDTTEGELNKVVEVTQKGYFIKNKLIRPARVKVGNGHTKKE